MSLDSALTFPELPITDLPSSAYLRLGGVRRSLGGRLLTPETRRLASPDEVLISMSTSGTLTVCRGTHFIVGCSPGCDEAIVRLYVLGAGFAALLWQRGVAVLHACAMARDGRSVLILGAKGRGKSSLAAALYARGWSLVADDVVGIEDGSTPAAVPGLPQLKLWPDSARTCLGEAAESLPRLVPGYEKRALRTERAFAERPVPIAAVYVLDDSSHTQAEAMVGQEAMVELVRHTYHAGLLRDMMLATNHLNQCAHLLRAVPVYRLRRRGDLLDLPQLAEFVEEHAARAC